MPFIIFCFFVVVSTGPAYAEWRPIYMGDEAGMTVYVDPETLRRKGNLAKLWILFDYQTTQKVGTNTFLSIKGYREFDCVEGRMRTLSLTQFSGNMGSGKPVYRADANDDNWVSIATTSVGQKLLEVACRTKPSPQSTLPE